MPEQPLPVYQIRDFNQPFPQDAGFYLKRFEDHFREHDFIQKPHKHDFFIFILFTKGTGTHTIDFKEYPVQPDSVFFLSPGQVHAWQLSPDTEGYVLFFSLEFYLLGHPLKKLQQFPFYSAWLQKPLLELDPKESKGVSELIKHLEQEYKNRQWKQEDVIRDYLDILFIQLTRLYRKTDETSLSESGSLSELQQLINLIDQHFKQHQPVSFYAEQLHVTTKQLNEACRHALGKTTSEIIQERVILEARRLLLHSGLTITQIASELGYFDNSYFTRFFKKNTGQTPEQFRQGLK